MGGRIVEECVSEPFQADLCRWARGIVTRDYTMFLRELSDSVLGRVSTVEATSTPVRVND